METEFAGRMRGEETAKAMYTRIKVGWILAKLAKQDLNRFKLKLHTFSGVSLTSFDLGQHCKVIILPTLVCQRVRFLYHPYSDL